MGVSIRKDLALLRQSSTPKAFPKIKDEDMNYEEKMAEATSMQLLKAIIGCHKYIKMASKELKNRLGEEDMDFILAVIEQMKG